MNKLITYVKESIAELQNKVTWPTWKELQSTLIVVTVGSLIFAFLIWGMDQIVAPLMENIYKLNS